MNRIIFIVALLMTASIFVLGQSTDNQAVQQTLKETATAMQNNDVAALDHLYANDYTFVSPTGVMLNKTERLAEIKSTKPFKSFAYENKKVRIYGNTSVVTAKAKNTVTEGDAYEFNVTLTLVKKDGRWQIVAGQATQLAPSQSGANDEQTLKRIEQEMTDDLIKGDASAFERYLADDYIFTAPDGRVISKPQSVSDISSGDLKIESLKFDAMKVRFYGNIGLVTYQTTDKGKLKGNDISGLYRWTDVFMKQGGRWKILATQGTRLSQQDKSQ
ncbi:MAG TPA: nuclear transport factor 2 family protein [Segetibacter sp.]|nr:nuclear transport factor 2 family protein [Segetibacter sp.]